MLTAVAIALVLLTPAIVIAAIAEVIEARRNATARVLARQIKLTDAVHAELGAIVAPIVEKPAFRPWRVVFPMRALCAADVDRLVSIADRVLGDELRSPENLQIVFTRRASLAHSRAA